MQAVAIGFTNLVFTILSMSLIDRLGRKKLLLAGACGTGACLAGVAFVFFTGRHQGALLWLLVAYIAFFAAMMVAQFFVVLFIYAETKGVSLREMEGKMSAFRQA